MKLNRLLVESGSITDAIELGDARVFDDAVPNCLIWRFEKGRSARAMRYCALGVGDNLAAGLAAPAWEERHLVEAGGHLMFAAATTRCAWPTWPLSRSARCRAQTSCPPTRCMATATSCARRRSAPARPADDLERAGRSAAGGAGAAQGARLL